MTSKQFFDATMRIQIERWTTDVAVADAAGFRQIAAEILGWIAEVEPLIRST